VLASIREGPIAVRVRGHVDGHHVPREPEEGYVLDRSNEARPLHHDLRDVLDRQVPPPSATGRPRVLLRQRGHASQRDLGRERGRGGGIVACLGRLRLDEPWALVPSAHPLQSPAGERERATSQVALVPVESPQRGGDVQPGVRGEVLGLVRLDHAEVSKESRVEVVEELAERRSMARLATASRREKSAWAVT
jgi:hypothetical protein